MKTIKYLLNKYHTLRDIDDKEYNTTKLDVDNVKFFNGLVEIFENFRLNIVDIWTYLLDLSENWRLGQIYEYDKFVGPIYIANQKLANILTSFRTFEDQVGNLLSRKFNKEDNKLIHFENIKKQVYEEYFAYRFFYRLRNYIQHFGLPLAEIAYNSNLIDLEKNTIHYSVDFIMKKKKLLEYNGWSTVKEEINHLNEKISTVEFLNEFFLAVFIIYKNIRSDVFDLYYKSKARLLKIYDDALKNSNASINEFNDISLIVQVFADETEENPLLFLPIDLIKRKDRLYFKHDLKDKAIINSYSYLKKS